MPPDAVEPRPPRSVAAALDPTAELGSARSSVVTVFEQLAAEGYIAARPGFGYFAPAAAIDSDDADRIG
jgi:DNA-binding transcriptional MocR family regulator